MSENGADVSWHDVGKVLEEEISSAEDIQADLVRNNKGNICQSIDNCMTVFQRDLLLKGAIRKNELSGKLLHFYVFHLQRPSGRCGCQNE